MNDIDFPAWLQAELTKNGWRSTDFAKKARLSDIAICRILRGERRADSETLTRFAKALNMSPIIIYRKAGLLPPDGGENVTYEDWKCLLSQLTPEEANELRQIAEMKIKRREKASALSNRSNPK